MVKIMKKIVFLQSVFAPFLIAFFGCWWWEMKQQFDSVYILGLLGFATEVSSFILCYRYNWHKKQTEKVHILGLCILLVCSVVLILGKFGIGYHNAFIYENNFITVITFIIMLTLLCYLYLIYLKSKA